MCGHGVLLTLVKKDPSWNVYKMVKVFIKIVFVKMVQVFKKMVQVLA